MGPPQRLWEAVREHAKLEGVRLHDLRHSFGATAADAGNTLILIASMLGHKQTRTTERYAKARRDVRQTAADSVSSELAALLAEPAVSPMPAPISIKQRKR
jgi:integrase